VPIHLLTTEAIAGYRRCLTDSGIILFHISNRYLRLAGILLSNARALDAYICYKINEGDGGRRYSSEWAAVTWDKDIFDKMLCGFKWKEPPLKAQQKILRPWTDKYSNLSGIIRIKNLSRDIKEFRPFNW